VGWEIQKSFKKTEDLSFRQKQKFLTDWLADWLTDWLIDWIPNKASEELLHVLLQVQLVYGPAAPLWVYASWFLRFHDHTHLDAPHSVELLWTSDRSVSGTSTWQHTTLTRHKYPCPPTSGGIWTHYPCKRSAEGPRVRPRGHCDRFCKYSAWV
jgi:hypothetical protein